MTTDGTYSFILLHECHERVADRVSLLGLTVPRARWSSLLQGIVNANRPSGYVYVLSLTRCTLEVSRAPLDHRVRMNRPGVGVVVRVVSWTVHHPRVLYR